MSACRRSYLLILLVFLITTVGLAIWMWFIRRLFPGLPATITLETHYMGVAPEVNPWLEPWQRWDTLCYQAIAERGYSAFETAYFAPPPFPYLMRWTVPLLGGNTLVAGLLVSGLAFFGCLLAFYHLARFEFGSEATAMWTSVRLASFPAAVFLVAAYNESLFLVGAILCLYFARREQWGAAGLAGGFAALARIPGAVLLFPLAYATGLSWRKGDRRAWIAIVTMGLVMASWYLYLWFGLGQKPVVVLESLQQRGDYLTFPGLSLVEAVRRILAGELVSENSLELAFTLIFIVFTVLIWKTLPRLYSVYAGSLMFFLFSRMGSPQPLVSMARYCMEIFPAFLLMAHWSMRPWVRRLILYLSWFGLLFFSAQFAIWGWVG